MPPPIMPSPSTTTPQSSLPNSQGSNPKSKLEPSSVVDSEELPVSRAHLGIRMNTFFMFINWLNAIRKEFRAIMTGFLLLTSMGMAQGLWRVPIPRGCYVGVTGAFLSWACFRAWETERVNVLKFVEGTNAHQLKKWVVIGTAK